MDTNDRRSITVVYTIVVGIIGLFLNSCVATPQFDSQPQFVQYSENKSTPIGTLLFTLRATDSTTPSNEMTIGTSDITTEMYVSISQGKKTSPTSANITLRKELDRESNEGGIELRFCLIDTRGNTILKSVRLYILDTCDESPQFASPSYSLEIDETNINRATLVYTWIYATDKDNGINAIVTYKMEPKTESEYLKELYKLTFRIEPTNGSIFLLRNLDYENNFFYHFTIYAQDTCNLTAEPADLRIMVKDVQDTPPFFIGLPYIKSVIEGTRDNTVLLRVIAMDGDLGIPNAISYFLSTNSKICHDHLVINASTGEIVVVGTLDWGMEEVRQIHGVCTFIVEAREIEKHPGNQKGKTVSNTTVTVTILRSNVHAPNLQSCVFNPINCSCICTEQQNVGPNNIVG